MTVDGKTYKQPLTVKMDPRVTITQGDLQQQLDFEMQIDQLITQSYILRLAARKPCGGSAA